MGYPSVHISMDARLPFNRNPKEVRYDSQDNEGSKTKRYKPENIARIIGTEQKIQLCYALILVVQSCPEDLRCSAV